MNKLIAKACINLIYYSLFCIITKIILNIIIEDISIIILYIMYVISIVIGYLVLKKGIIEIKMR